MISLEMIDFNTLTKIAQECGRCGQINCCQRFYKLAQSSPINRPIWSHWSQWSLYTLAMSWTYSAKLKVGRVCPILGRNQSHRSKFDGSEAFNYSLTSEYFIQNSDLTMDAGTKNNDSFNASDYYYHLERSSLARQSIFIMGHYWPLFVYFRSFLTNSRKFTTNWCDKMSSQYVVLWFELTTSWTSIFSFNYKARAPPQSLSNLKDIVHKQFGVCQAWIG